MKLYVVGASGMLGSSFIDYWASEHSLRLPGVDSERIDVTDYNALKTDIEKFNPDVIVNLAAICDMEKCEKVPDQALKVHVLGSANLALVALDLRKVYIYLSSACVFNGEEDKYDSRSFPEPISTYGKTKYMGENVARIVPRHIVVRTEWCFGGGPTKDTKFIGKIYKQIAAGAKSISAVEDKYGSLSYLPHLWEAVNSLLAYSMFGTYHICCEGSANRYEIAKEFVRLLGKEIEVIPVQSSFFEKEYFAKRPKSEVLENSYIPDFKARSWKDCLAEYSEKFKV